MQQADGTYPGGCDRRKILSTDLICKPLSSDMKITRSRVKVLKFLVMMYHVGDHKRQHCIR